MSGRESLEYAAECMGQAKTAHSDQGRLACLATTSAEYEAAQYHTPKITCPRCSTIMRLARIEQAPNQEARLVFDCTCGFEYRMWERVRSGI
jgi:hypothetical protein